MSAAKMILATTDGSVRSQRALPHVAAFAKACDADVAVATVLDPRKSPSPERLVETRDAAAHQLRGIIARAGLEAAPLVTTLLAGEDVPGAILRVASEQGAQLLAMSSRGRGLTSRALFGSVAASVLARSELPLMACGPNIEYPSATGDYRILFSSDGSPASELVFRELAPFLEGTRVEAHLLHVYMSALGDRGERAEVEAARERLADLARLLPDGVRFSIGVDAKTSLGGPAQRIVRHAAAVGADAIALSTRGHRLGHSLALGSVAMDVCRLSPLPVVLAGVS